MTRNDEHRPDGLVTDLIDGEVGDCSPDPADLSREELERIADLQLVHSLLVRSRLGQEEVIDREARIRAVTTRMRTEPIEPPLHLGSVVVTMGRSRGVELAAAACLVLALGLTWLGYTESEAVAARAAVAQAMSASEQAQDRTYSVAFMAEEHTIMQGVLRLRGADRFVFERPTHRGGNVYVGRDEQGLWMRAPGHWAGGEVRRPGNEREIGRSLRGLDAPMPFLTMGNALRNFQENFKTISHRKDEITGMRFLRGVRKGGDLTDPDLVEIWIDDETRLVHRVELGWSDALRQKIHAHWREHVSHRMEERQAAGDDANSELRRQRSNEMRHRVGEKRRGQDGESRRNRFRHPHRILIELIDEKPIDDDAFRPDSYQ